MKALLLPGLYLVVACSTGDAGKADQASQVTVFEGAQLITGDGGEPIEDAVFVVAEGRFAEVGRRGHLEVPEGATRVDLAGRTVMPVIINTHLHLPSTREALIEQLEHNAFYGVGAVVSLGEDSGDVPFQLRQETIPGAARYLTAGRGITRPEPGRSEVHYWINSEEEAREAVRELAEQRVDIVKIWVDDWGGRYEKLTPELYGAIIEEAHQSGLRVTAHIFALEDAKGLLRGGIDAFAHSVQDQGVDEEFLTLIGERPRVVYVPNLPDRGVARDLTWLRGTVPPDELGRLQEASTDRAAAQQRFALQAGNLVRLSAAGVRIGFGTDGGAAWSAHLEMEDMVAAGMTPAQVIVSATRSSAELLQLNDLGTVAAGKSADFIVLEADPLDDITNTRRIESVYLRGAEVDREAVSARLTGQTVP